MADSESLQAAQLVSALRDQLHQMTAELLRLERKHVRAGSSSRATLSKAAGLRRDIQEAEMLIDRLRRRYSRISERPAPAVPPRRTDMRTQNRSCVTASSNSERRHISQSGR